MKRDKIKLYFLELLLLIILFVALIVSNNTSYILLALLLTAYMVIVKVSLKKKNTLSIYKKQVTFLMVGFALIYLGLFYLLGFIINDFVRQPLIFSLAVLLKIIIPIAIIIISSEIMRYAFLSQKAIVRIFKKEIDLSKVITFINMVLVDLIIYTSVYNLANYDDFITTIGFILFASVSCNLFYNYVSNRYGILGIIGYRMITVLYVYIIPVMPNVYVYFKSFVRMLYPYIMYLVLEKTYSKTDFVVSYSERKKNFIGISVLVVVMTVITMLISCQFSYGVLVTGSGSMKGALDIGDAVVFQKYDDQNIKTGQIIIFEKNGLNIMHRVIDKKDVNGQIRYYTKGDANKEMDSGFITNDEIVGVTLFRIRYVGYPTIWLRRMFS